MSSNFQFTDLLSHKTTIDISRINSTIEFSQMPKRGASKRAIVTRKMAQAKETLEDIEIVQDRDTEQTIQDFSLYPNQGTQIFRTPPSQSRSQPLNRTVAHSVAMARSLDQDFQLQTSIADGIRNLEIEHGEDGEIEDSHDRITEKPQDEATLNIQAMKKMIADLIKDTTTRNKNNANSISYSAYSK